MVQTKSNCYDWEDGSAHRPGWQRHPPICYSPCHVDDCRPRASRSGERRATGRRTCKDFLIRCHSSRRVTNCRSAVVRRSVFSSPPGPIPLAGRSENLESSTPCSLDTLALWFLGQLPLSRRRSPTSVLRAADSKTKVLTSSSFCSSPRTDTQPYANATCVRKWSLGLSRPTLPS
jgi:hypothetical protein